MPGLGIEGEPSGLLGNRTNTSSGIVRPTPAEDAWRLQFTLSREATIGVLTQSDGLRVLAFLLYPLKPLPLAHRIVRSPHPGRVLVKLPASSQRPDLGVYPCPNPAWTMACSDWQVPGPGALAPHPGPLPSLGSASFNSSSQMRWPPCNKLQELRLLQRPPPNHCPSPQASNLGVGIRTYVGLRRAPLTPPTQPIQPANPLDVA